MMSAVRTAKGSAADTKRRILEAARLAIDARGHTRVTMREVAQKAGVSVSVVAHHFIDKDGLVGACIDIAYEELRSMATEMLTLLASGQPPEQVLEHAARTGFRFTRAHRPALRALQARVIDRGGIDPRRRGELHIPFIEALAAWLGTRVDRPAAEMRLRVQSMVFLVVRYGVARDADLLRLTGAADIAGAEDAIADHLVWQAKATLLSRT
jgi:AcrR family transcriptional regulator